MTSSRTRLKIVNLFSVDYNIQNIGDSSRSFYTLKVSCEVICW